MENNENSFEKDIDDFNALNEINNFVSDQDFSDISSIELEQNDNGAINDEMPFILNQNENEIEIKPKKRTREDLNTTPLPIFECIYCTNKKIVYDKLSQYYLLRKYKFNSTRKDMELITKLITGPIVYLRTDTPQVRKYKQLIVAHTEYLAKYYPAHEAKIQTTKDVQYKPNTLFNILGIKSTHSPNHIPYMTTPLKFNLIPSRDHLMTNEGDNKKLFDTEEKFVIDEEDENSNDNILTNRNMEKFLNEVDEECNMSLSDVLNYDKFKRIRKEDIIWDEEVHDIWNPSFSTQENLSLCKDEIKDENNNPCSVIQRSTYEDNSSLGLSSNYANILDTNSNIRISSEISSVIGNKNFSCLSPYLESKTSRTKIITNRSMQTPGEVTTLRRSSMRVMKIVERLNTKSKEIVYSKHLENSKNSIINNSSKTQNSFTELKRKIGLIDTNPLKLKSFLLNTSNSLNSTKHCSKGLNSTLSPKSQIVKKQNFYKSISIFNTSPDRSKTDNILKSNIKTNHTNTFLFNKPSMELNRNSKPASKIDMMINNLKFRKENLFTGKYSLIDFGNLKSQEMKKFKILLK